MYTCLYRNQIDGVHVVWLDNFSKFIAKSVPTTRKGVVASCLWTGKAIFQNDAMNNITSQLQYNGNAIVPAMPDDILAHKHEVMVAVDYVMQGIRTYYNGSLVRRYDVRNVPPKINTKVYTEMKSVVNDAKNSTKCVTPVSLIDQNIGANKDLLTIMWNIYETSGMSTDSCDTYSLYNFDENIYWRVLKVHILIDIVVCMYVCTYCTNICYFL